MIGHEEQDQWLYLLECKIKISVFGYHYEKRMEEMMLDTQWGNLGRFRKYLFCLRENNCSKGKSQVSSLLVNTCAKARMGDVTY